MKFNLNRFTNTLLLGIVLILTLTGVYGLFWTLQGWLFDLHRLSGWALAAAIPWKTAIAARSLRRGLRPNFDRGVMILLSLLLAAVTLVVFALGILWNWRLGPEDYWLRQTAISWHWMLALGLLLPFLIHVWQRWPRPQRVDFTSRRAFLKGAALSAAAVAGWWLAESLAARRELLSAPRRYTGSRLDGLFSGNLFPVTHTIAARPEQVDPAVWRLRIEGAVEKPLELTYEELLAQANHSQEEVLDCTLGWYTLQQWSGIPLAGLLASAGAARGILGVQFTSVTGYGHFLPAAEARQTLLATHVGGETLEHDHGFPLRLVVPGRRGWFWVKWLEHIQIIALE